MKPAREPASSRPKALCIPEKRPTNLARSPLLVGLRRKKTDCGQRSAVLSSLQVLAFDYRAQGFSTPLARRRSSCPLSSPNLVLTHVDRTCHGTLARAAAHHQAFRDDSTPCLSHPTTNTSRRAPNWSSEEAHLVNTILNQPNRRRVSTDRLNRAKTASWLHLLRVESSPTPAGKTPIH